MIDRYTVERYWLGNNDIDNGIININIEIMQTVDNNCCTGKELQSLLYEELRAKRLIGKRQFCVQRSMLWFKTAGQKADLFLVIYSVQELNVI